MAYLNKTTLLGHLTADPELSFTKNGIPYCRFSIAQNPRNQEGQEMPPEFFDCVVWRGWAENFVKDASKGALVLADGRIRQESWEDQESGQKRSKLRVMARLVVVIPRLHSSTEVPVGVETESTPESIPF
jgi:single-strand DNA-binding protein